MAELLNRIQQMTAGRVRPGSTAAAAKTAAAASGTAATAATPILSQSEMLATSTGNAQLGELQKKVAQAAEQARIADENRKAQEALARKDIDLQQQAMQQQSQQARQQILDKESEAAKELQVKQHVDNTRREINKLELQSKQTQDKLRIAAAREGIRDIETANIASTQQDMSDATELLKNTLSQNEILAQGALDDASVLKRMEMAFGQHLANLGISQQNIKQFYAGLGGLGAAGIDAYSSYKKGDFNEDYQKKKAEKEGKYTFEQYQQETKV